MSAPEDPEGKAPAKSEKDTETPAETPQDPVADGAAQAADSSSEKSAAAKKSTSSSKRAIKRSAELKAERPVTSGPKTDRAKSKEAKSETPAPPKKRRFAPGMAIAAVIVLIILAVPALFALCLNQSGSPLTIAATPEGPEVGCGTVAGHFGDCYLSEEVTVSAPPADKRSGLDAFCCDYVLDRSLDLSAEYTEAGGTAPKTLAMSSPDIALADGTRLTGSPVRFEDEAPIKRTLRVTATPVYSVPLLSWLEQETGKKMRFDIGALVAKLAPAAARARTGSETVSIGADGTMVRLATAGVPLAQISIRARTTPTLLFGDVAGDNQLAAILTDPSRLPSGGTGWLARRIQTVASGGHGEILTRFGALSQFTVSRTDPDSGAEDAGKACIAFYRVMRDRFSRFDAAVATYVAARPTGLLTSLSPDDRHGCRDDAQATASADLDTDWQMLDAPFEEAAPAAPETTAKAETDDQEQEAVIRLLLDLASAAKSGAHLADLKASMNDPLAVRFGRSGQPLSGQRASVLRMLHRQWSHMGCWIYHPGKDSFGSAMLLAEAQYPYLNRFKLGFDETGLVKELEIAGVTFDDILRFKAANRGRECQDFLNSARLAVYRDWYADNPVGQPTPSDHAERLFSEGLQQKFQLN